MLIGYARVSTEEQNLDLQIDALTKAGCEKIFSDKDSRTSFNRSGLLEALDYLREGDTLVIWKLDRLGGRTKNLLELFDVLQQRNINLKSIKDSIDTGSAIGKLFFHFSSALAEFEVDMLRERTRAGLAAARARGRLGGRPKSLTENQKQQALDLYYSKKHTVNSICETLNISKGTFYNYLKQENRLNGKGIKESP